MFLTEGIPGSGRGHGEGRYSNKQQPRDQLAAIGQFSGTKSPAAKWNQLIARGQLSGTKSLADR